MSDIQPDKSEQRDVYVLLKIPFYGKIEQGKKSLRLLLRALHVQQSSEIKMWFLHKTGDQKREDFYGLLTELKADSVYDIDRSAIMRCYDKSRGKKDEITPIEWSGDVG